MKGNESGIQTRVLIVALAPVIVTAVALTLYFTLLRYNDVEAELRQRGFAMARQLSASAQYGLFSGNTADLSRLAQVLAHEPDVSAITVYDRHDAPLAIIGTPLALPPPSSLSDGWNGRSRQDKSLLFHNKVFAHSLPPDSADPEKSPAPAPLLLGSVTIELSRDNPVARKREILLFTIGAGLLILLAAGLIARRLGRDISEPIIALEYAVNKIRDGLLDSRVHPHPAGTLRSLEAGINAMAIALEQARMLSAEALNSTSRQLQQQSDFANALLDAQSEAGVSLVIIDDGVILFANKAALDLVGMSANDAGRMPASTGVATQDKEEFERQYQRVLRSEVPYSRVEFRIDSNEGNSRWAEAIVFGMRRNDKRMVALLGIDISQRKHDADRLMEAHEQLRAQKEEAERASAAKSRFLAAASHDLRQPLHALTLFAAQLRARTTTPAQSRLAARIDEAIGNLSELLGSLLDISKIDLTTIRPDVRVIELSQLFDQVATSHRHAAANKHLKLHIAQTSLRVSSDPMLLFRIVSNLASNAVRYTERGSVLIGARRAGHMVRIEIWDTGIGIQEKHIPFLFQEFYQVANPERDAGKGLGLGLAIVERLVNLLGHKIGVRSMPGAGSVFTVVVPRATTEKSALGAVRRGESETSIVIVIEEQARWNELVPLLNRWGYAVTVCRRDTLLQVLDAAKPDLVICEQTCPCLKQGPTTFVPHEIPVICVMGEAEMPDTIEVERLCSPLAAPVKPAKLRALILHLLAQKEDVEPKTGSSVS